jgi:hypothetical protein
MQPWSPTMHLFPAHGQEPSKSGPIGPQIGTARRIRPPGGKSAPRPMSSRRTERPIDWRQRVHSRAPPLAQRDRCLNGLYGRQGAWHPPRRWSGGAEQAQAHRRQTGLAMPASEGGQSVERPATLRPMPINQRAARDRALSAVARGAAGTPMRRPVRLSTASRLRSRILSSTTILCISSMSCTCALQSSISGT